MDRPEQSEVVSLFREFLAENPGEAYRFAWLALWQLETRGISTEEAVVLLDGGRLGGGGAKALAAAASVGGGRHERDLCIAGGCERCL